MVKYYFFKSEYATNAQGERRTILRPLPNQMTYNNRTNSMIPVRTDIRAQADNESLGRIVRSAIGTVWGIAVEGRTQHASSLKVYTRGSMSFYQARQCVEEYNFEGEMLTAYNTLLSLNEPQLFDDDIPLPSDNRGPAHRNTGFSPFNEHLIIRHTLDKGREFANTLLNTSTVTDPRKKVELSRLNDMLSTGIVTFKYEKNTDGSIRTAKGTRNMSIIQQLIDRDDWGRPSENRANTPFDGMHVNYFDIDRMDWRSFTVNKYLETLYDTFTTKISRNVA